MSGDDKDELLRMLEAHGQQFWGSLGAEAVSGKRKSSGPTSERKHKKWRVDEVSDHDTVSEELEEEWAGFSGEESEEEVPEGEDIDEDSVPHPSAAPDVVVFSDFSATAGPSTLSVSKAQQKAFMVGKFCSM